MTGAPPSGVTIEAFPAGSSAPSGSAFTDGSGNYTLAGLAPGTYRVGFFASDRVTQYFDQKPSLALADPITLGPGGSATANASLVPAGAISGTVKDAAGNPVSGAAVTVYDAGGNVVAFAGTGRTGPTRRSRSSPALTRSSSTPPGSSRSSTRQGFDRHRHPGRRPVGCDATADATLAPAGSPPATGTIAGLVTDDMSRPLDNIAVIVTDSSGGFVTETFTAVDGTYTISGVAPGTYGVTFQAVSQDPRHDYVPQTTSPVTVTAGATTTVDASLTTGAEISGVVTDAAGNARSGLRVDLYDASKQLIASTSTAGDGSYTFAGLAAGTYYVGFDTSFFCGDECGGALPAVSSNALLPQFYDRQLSLATATPISARSPARTAPASTPCSPSAARSSARSPGRRRATRCAGWM